MSPPLRQLQVVPAIPWTFSQRPGLAGNADVALPIGHNVQGELHQALNVVVVADQDIDHLHRHQLLATGGKGEPVHRVVLTDITQHRRMQAEPLASALQVHGQRPLHRTDARI